MTHCRMALAAFAITALAGCASSAVVSQATSLADAGIAYGAAAQEVIPLARDRYLDWQSDSLLEELQDRTHCTAEEVAGEASRSPDCEALRTDFEETQATQVKLVELFAELSAHADALGRYFQSLKVLAEYDSATTAANAAGRAIDRINGLSDTLEGSANVSTEQKNAWTALIGLVGDSIKAAKLRERLKADADDIGRAIDIQDGVLEANSALLGGLDEAARREAFIENVQTPYLTGSVDDATRWRTARRASMFPGPVIAQLKSLESASEQLRDVWEDILAGRGSSEAAQRVFEDIARALEVVNAVREANKHND